MFTSPKMYNRFVALGFTNRKTWDITPHSELKFSRDFWRGVVDGDGWVINKSVVGIGLCGHQNTIVEFLDFLKISGLVIGTNPAKSKKSDHLWSCDIHSHKAVSVLNLLYKDSCVYLDRKYQKYLDICNK